MRGNIVMKGYLKNPKATEEAFAGGWFHTGDLAVAHPDGYIEIKDRSKDIIISGGENISTIEVEDVLYRHPAVLEAAVVAKPDERWGETPCAFVTLKATAPPPAPTTSSPSAASTWRISRRRAMSCSARCRRPRPARSRNSCCASGRRAPDPLAIHSLFDLLALLVAIAVYRLAPVATSGVPAEPWKVHPLYIAAGAGGATIGAYLFGSANLWLSGIGGVARSIEGAIAGGIVGIEALKWRSGIRGSTGLRFVAPLAAAIAVGRLGCFFAGLDDMTYGTPTALPWGVDFGDGVPRHPGAALRSRRDGGIFVRFRTVAAPGSGVRCGEPAFICSSRSTRFSGSAGSSSSPTGRSSGR